MICQGCRSGDTKVNKKHKIPSLITLIIWGIRNTSKQRREDRKRRNGAEEEGKKGGRREGEKNFFSYTDKHNKEIKTGKCIE